MAFSKYMIFQNNDLYKFKQSTKDLKHANSSHISALKNFLQSDVRHWLQNVTGIELNQEIDLFCAKIHGPLAMRLNLKEGDLLL